MEQDYRTKLAQAVKMIEEKGKAYAQARALSWQFQELRKVILADETRKAQGSSAVERETNARCSEHYKSHIEATKEAIQQELTLKAEFTRWQVQWESLRSLLSLEKKQMEVFREEEE